MCTFIRVNNFFVCGPKYAKFFSPNVVGAVDDQELFRFLYIDPFQRYSRSKFKVVQNREKFWTIFWPSQIFWGGHCNNYIHFKWRMR